MSRAATCKSFGIPSVWGIEVFNTAMLMSTMHISSGIHMLPTGLTGVTGDKEIDTWTESLGWGAMGLMELYQQLWNPVFVYNWTRRGEVLGYDPSGGRSCVWFFLHTLSTIRSLENQVIHPSLTQPPKPNPGKALPFILVSLKHCGLQHGHGNVINTHLYRTSSVPRSSYSFFCQLDTN